MPAPRSPYPEHFDGKRFFNPNAPQARGFLDVVRWQLNGAARTPSPLFVDDVKPSIPPAQIEGDQMEVTLINHSTVLFQQRGLHFLSDPIWSERASPLSWIGPKRRRRPGVRREDLPRIDVVLLSHNHYDHLDLPTLRWLAGRGPMAFVVPLGVAALLRWEKLGPVYELDWGGTQVFGATTVHSVPALHFSARGPFDRNRTLWCGYVIESPGRTVYFAGDTAFGDHFSMIRERFGAPNLALLPIGAYEPRWFMGAIHMAPEQALEAHRLLASEVSIAIHHGTFQLADDGLDEARGRLSTPSRPESFMLLKNGESIGIA